MNREDPATEPQQVAWTVALHDALAANDTGVYSNSLEAARLGRPCSDPF